MNIIPINLDPGDSAARRIRPMVGLPAMPAVKAVAQPMTSPDPSAMYNRRQIIARDRAREEDAARIRAEVRDEARKTARMKRRQDLEDDVRDRNREIEDLDRIRTERLADDELEYERGATERERDTERYKREVEDRKYQLVLRERADKAYKRELTEQVEEKARIKAERMMKLKEGYLGLMGGAESSRIINAQRAVLQNERTRYAQLNMQNKDEFAISVIGHFLNEVLNEDSPFLTDEQRESARAMFKQEGYDLDAGGDIALLKLRGPKAQEMVSSISLYGDQATAITKYQSVFAEKQVENNRRIGEYDKMLNELADEKTLTEVQVDGLKELYRQRIKEMGGSVDAIDPPAPEIEQEPVGQVDDQKFDVYAYVDEMGITEEEEDALLDMFDPEGLQKGDAPLIELNLNKEEIDRALELIKRQKIIQSDMQDKQSEIDDKENENPTVTGDIIDGGKNLIKGAKELAENSGVGDVAAEIGTTLAGAGIAQQTLADDSTLKKVTSQGRALLTPTDKKVDETLDALADAETNAKTNPDAIKGSAYQNQMNEFGRKYGFKQFTKKPPTATKDLPKYFTEIEDHFTSQAQAKVKDRLNSVITKARNTGDKMRSSKIGRILTLVGASIAIGDLIRLLSYDGSENDEEIQALKQELSTMEKDYQAIKTVRQYMARDYMERIEEEMEGRKQ